MILAHGRVDFLSDRTKVWSGFCPLNFQVRVLASKESYKGVPNMAKTILRLPAVKASNGLSRSTHYLRIAQGLYTKPVSLGGRCVGWPSDEVAALNAARIAGKSDAEIRDLVVTLEAARKTAVGGAR
jgi:prophage regulatory protein